MEEAKERKQLESKAVAADKKKKEAAGTKQLESEADAPDKKKKSCIVEWTPEEDDILREQIEVLGTESWTAIASKFKGKTSRQCRRRWFFCLNTDLKKGNWSPEEDKLLFKAQMKYGNRWTEIAKVVKGRTDNAVKNRFTALCKKRQALGKENSTLDINENGKRPISNDVGSQSKERRVAKRRGPLTRCNNGNASDKVPVNGRKQQPRLALVELSQNIQKSDAPETSTDGDRKTEGFSNSLATELITLRTEENMDNALNDFQDLQDFLHKDKHSDEESSPFEEHFDIHLVNDLLTMDFRNELSNTTEVQSETIDTNGVNTKAPATETTDQEDLSALCYDPNNEDASTILLGNVIQTPLFKSLAATIPSPQFSASERRYLMKTLGIESPPLEKATDHLQMPSCRRSLVHIL